MSHHIKAEPTADGWVKLLCFLHLRNFISLLEDKF